MHLYIGMAGSALCAIALAITLFKSGFGDSNGYRILNLFGGIFLLYYAIIERVIPFIILESIWVALPLSIMILSKIKFFTKKT